MKGLFSRGIPCSALTSSTIDAIAFSGTRSPHSSAKRVRAVRIFGKAPRAEEERAITSCPEEAIHFSNDRIRSSSSRCSCSPRNLSVMWRAFADTHFKSGKTKRRVSTVCQSFFCTAGGNSMQKKERSIPFIECSTPLPFSGAAKALYSSHFYVSGVCPRGNDAKMHVRRKDLQERTRRRLPVFLQSRLLVPRLL